MLLFFFFQAEDGIRDRSPSRGLGDVYKRQAQEMNGWLHYGGGLELWEEAYAPFNLIPLAGGNTGVQMAGWFKKEINSLEDMLSLIHI